MCIYIFQQQLFVLLTAGIPAPVYFGVLIDTSCLKWGFKKCGSRGSCRLYDSNAFRYCIKLFSACHCYIPVLHRAISTDNFLCRFIACKEKESLIKKYVLFYKIILLLLDYLTRSFIFSPMPNLDYHLNEQSLKIYIT